MSGIKNMNDDYTPEKVILEVSKLILENSYISYFGVTKEVLPTEVPTISIDIELYESKDGE